jgi:hypothetical protein
VTELAAAPRARVRSLVVAVPAWVWLAALIAISALVRFLLGRRSPAPWIFVDELIYSELAKSFAAHGELAVRDVASNGYGFVYPALISPAYLLFDNVAHAYAAAKAINAVLMSLAAIPAYLLGRRLLGHFASLAVATLSVALPALAYTGTIMTENAFYPLFLLCVLAIMATLEHPSGFRQLSTLSLVVLAFLTRPQAVALLAALVGAIFLHALLEARVRGGLRRRLAAFRATWLVLAAGAALLALVQLGRGRSVTEVVGAYRSAGSSDYSVGTAARYVLYHLAELDLLLGVLPLVAFVLMVGLALAAGASTRERAFAATAIPVVVSLILLVGVFASQPSVLRIQERNLFYVAPLFLVALLAWVERGLPRPRLQTAAATAGAVGLLATIPYEKFINVSAVSDTFALLPLWNLQDSVISGDDVHWLVLAVGLAAGVLVVVLPRRLGLVAPALVLVYFAAAHHAVGQRIEHASAGALFAGIRVEREWIDDTLPEGAVAAAVWTGGTAVHAIWENEFFNRGVGPVYYLGAPLPGNLPETQVGVDPGTGELRDADGRAVVADYALVDGSMDLEGAPIARDQLVGLTLYRVGGPLVNAAQVAGLYPDFAWSGPEVTYTRRGCTGGRLVLGLTSDPVLFDRPQTVRAFVGGREVARAHVRPTTVGRLWTVPLTGVAGECRVRFTIAPTAVPDEVLGNGDTRELGVHFASIRFEQPGS